MGTTTDLANAGLRPGAGASGVADASVINIR
jgi:hypothetical protein